MEKSFLTLTQARLKIFDRNLRNRLFRRQGEAGQADKQWAGADESQGKLSESNGLFTRPISGHNFVLI